MPICCCDREFYTLQGPCAIFAKKAALEAVKGDFGAPGQETIAMSGDYVWVYGLAPEVNLPGGHSTIWAGFGSRTQVKRHYKVKRESSCPRAKKYIRSCGISSFARGWW